MKILMAIIVLLLAGFVFAMVGAGVSAYQHARELRINGCQERARTPTGTYRWVGRSRQQETMVAYECVDGLRVEIQ